MREKLRFHQASDKLQEEQEDRREQLLDGVWASPSENTVRETEENIGVHICDIELDTALLISDTGMPSTVVKKACVHERFDDIVDVFDVVDVLLDSSGFVELHPMVGTRVSETVGKQMFDKEVVVVHDIDLMLDTEVEIERVEDMKTNVLSVDVSMSLESLFSSSSEGKQKLVFEELIGCSGRIPRSFSESFNRPFILLVGEDEREWHVPIIYALKELFCEITDKRPRVTFREPEVSEKGEEEHVDSLDLHSLESFAFENKIEFLDARKALWAVEEFVRTVRGRISSAFLQQLGILVIAVKKKNLGKVKKYLKTCRGINVYLCNPNDSKYEEFCSKVLGVGHTIGSTGDFFSMLKEYDTYLSYTVRKFSVFVKRSADTTDRIQYPLKVAVFVYLLNEVRKRKKKLLEELKDFEKLCMFVEEVKDYIKVEESVENTVPDIIYSCDGKNVFIEIETLAGTLEPLKKIDETIEKYREKPEATVIWVVLKPVSALLHYEELKAREKAYKIMYGDKKIEFKVLVLKAYKNKHWWELISLDDFVRGGWIASYP